MTDERKSDELDRAVGSVISRGEFVSTGDEDLDSLARLASGLRGLPRPEFRTRLRAELLPRSARRVPWPSSGAPGRWVSSVWSSAWPRRQRPFLAAGSSCGLAAGACCISGFAASVLGIASAAAVQAYIETSLPYFVALSIAGMLGWLLWRLRDQGITPATVARTLQRHGVAMGSSYAAVFGASMVLAMSAGLY